MQANKFTVIVNPFLKSIQLQHETDNGTLIQDIYWNEIDQWFTIASNGLYFDVHFLYDIDCTVSIYEFKDGTQDYSNTCTIDLQIQY